MQTTIKSSKCPIEAEIRKDQLMIFCYHPIYDNVAGVVMGLWWACMGWGKGGDGGGVGGGDHMVGTWWARMGQGVLN